MKALKLSTFEIRRKRVETNNRISCRENADGPANNLRSKGVCFRRRTANVPKVGKIRDNFLLNRTILLWNDPPVKVKDGLRLCIKGWCGRVGKAIALDAESVEFKSQRSTKNVQKPF